MNMFMAELLVGRVGSVFVGLCSECNIYVQYKPGWWFQPI